MDIKLSAADATSLHSLLLKWSASFEFSMSRFDVKLDQLERSGYFALPPPAAPPPSPPAPALPVPLPQPARLVPPPPLSSLPSSPPQPSPSTVAPLFLPNRAPSDPFLLSVDAPPPSQLLLLTTTPPDKSNAMLQSIFFCSTPPLHLAAPSTATRYKALFWREIKEPEKPHILLAFELEDKLKMKDG